ncbi:hypothetical protein BACUNI_00267 [Bacteroides uniformis ATCC 8492]|uniref:Uncharacterized protein n=1 Tax=Bacteroides uniformis (strain ATCC 8492 / DSM 6597 / CCUG 4942 / CIP 103695 / JCM 5828 / KCTC 5204 / NCTC 13054 / VPI 0061) TaxID=411479 RepID=A0ABC9NH95_BACUC|nr:hypothetical protein BACUNI_00267 [Bacteroides uniformis ATCC 8492]
MSYLRYKSLSLWRFLAENKIQINLDTTENGTRRRF